MSQKINSNTDVSRNETYGKVYLPKTREAFTSQSVTDKAKNKKVYSKGKKSYGSKGAYSIER